VTGSARAATGKADLNKIRGVPDQSYAHHAVAAVLGVRRAAAVPLGITTPEQPNISSTIWRTIADDRNLAYYFDSATRPNTVRASLAKLLLREGAPAKRLVIRHGEIYAGETADRFEDVGAFSLFP
jgi:choloylglycine hydrolase